MQWGTMNGRRTYLFECTLARTCARSEISAVHFIRWRGGAERRAGISFCTIRRRRWPLAAGRWPTNLNVAEIGLN